MPSTFAINDIPCTYATSWEEATPNMVQSIAPYIVGKPAQEMQAAVELSKQGKGKNQQRIDDANQKYMACAMPILRHIITKGGLPFWKEFAKLTPEYYAMIIASDENPTKWCFNIELSAQLFPKWRIALKYYHGPRSYLKGMCFGEYLYAQAQYSAWIETRSHQDLAQFFGTLYRPLRQDVSEESEEFADDCRKPFIAATSPQYAKRFYNTDENLMLHSIVYWMGCHAKMRKQYPWIFQGTSSNDSDPGAVVVGLAKSAGKDDVSQILRASVHTIMTKLNADAKAAAKRKR